MIYTVSLLIVNISGSFSVVKECYRKDTKEKYAMKIIKKRCVKEMCLLENEVQILKEVNHPNIIQVNLVSAL